MNTADSWNLGCLCSTLQRALLQMGAGGTGLDEIAQQLETSHPHLFSASPVFISEQDFKTMQTGIQTLHRITGLAGYQAAALAQAPAIAARAFGPAGVFMGYDFHIGADGPRLIEINTNAGGAFLHAMAARAHRACCTPFDGMFGGPADLNRLDQVFMDMFRTEWRLQRQNAVLRTVIIADDAPHRQFLAPEFELARRLFVANGLQAVIADPQELEWREGRLWHRALPAETPVDLVYNRLTDFDLSDPAHAALRSAYLSGAAVITPHPRAHALHADKRNLAALSDDEQLATWGVSSADRELLRQLVPSTRRVTTANADVLWAQRKRLFFKPAGGYGSKAAYRGDKLTRGVWGEIIQGGFVAQDLVPPGERMVCVDGEPTRLKVDIRAYAYQGRIQLLAARTYSGQTTNFRTAGGGFSPVVVLPSPSSRTEAAADASLACEC